MSGKRTTLTDEEREQLTKLEEEISRALNIDLNKFNPPTAKPQGKKE